MLSKHSNLISCSIINNTANQIFANFSHIFIQNSKLSGSCFKKEIPRICSVTRVTSDINIQFVFAFIDLKMSDQLTKSGIFFDEVDKVRILDPVASKQTNDLKDECKIYIEKINEFQKISNGFITIVGKLAQEVEKQKIKAIGARNILQTMEKQKDLNHQQLQALISEKMMQLERLKVLCNSLQKTEMEQNEIINRLTHY